MHRAAMCRIEKWHGIFPGRRGCRRRFRPATRIRRNDQQGPCDDESASNGDPDETGMNVQSNASEAGNNELRQMTTRLMRGENLSRVDAANFLEALLSPAATDA